MSSAQKKRAYGTRGQGRADEHIPYIAHRRPVVHFRMHVVALTELATLSVGISIRGFMGVSVLRLWRSIIEEQVRFL